MPLANAAGLSAAQVQALIDAAIAGIPAGPRVLFDHILDVSSVNTDGTEDDLYSDTIAGGTITADGQKLIQSEVIELVASVTATRVVKKYFGGNIIWDSGSMGLNVFGDSEFWRIDTLIIATTGANKFRAVVRATRLLSNGSFPFVTYTTNTNVDFTNSLILKTTGTAGGVGAASDDIVEHISSTSFIPAAAP